MSGDRSAFFLGRDWSVGHKDTGLRRFEKSCCILGQVDAANNIRADWLGYD